MPGPGPRLRDEILALKLKLDLAPPSECESISAEIDAKFDELCLVSKRAGWQMRAAIRDKYPAYVRLNRPAPQVQVPAVKPQESLDLG